MKSGEAGPYWIGVASVGPMNTVDGERRDEMAASPQQIAELAIDLNRLGTDGVWNKRFARCLGLTCLVW